MLKAHTMLCRGEKRGVHASNPAVLHSQLTAVAARPNVRLDQTGWIRSLSATLICITEDTTENRKDVFLKLWNYKTSSDTLSATFLSLQLVDLNLHTKSLWIPECLFFSSMLSNPFKPVCTSKLSILEFFFRFSGHPRLYWQLWRIKNLSSFCHIYCQIHLAHYYFKFRQIS